MTVTNRRTFLGTISSLVALTSVAAKKKDSLPISCSAYDWTTFYARDGKTWGKDWDSCLSHFAESGIAAIEPSITQVSDIELLKPFLKKYNIALPSIYVNSLLHEKTDAQKSVDDVLKIAQAAKQLDTKIIVTNPNPIRWGSSILKTDEQIRCQTQYLDILGAALRKLGIKLAYHTHDIEMKASAREFHHVLQNTSPQNVYFCFDTHWVYRGAENSELALFDVLKMYGNRIIELHLRQSKDGVWTDILTVDGDIDYHKFASELRKMNIKPHLVIEQCLEAKSVVKHNVVEAHKIDLESVKEIFTS